jgi:hypothetical protein
MGPTTEGGDTFVAEDEDTTVAKHLDFNATQTPVLAATRFRAPTPPSQARAPSPTINTKAALADVMAMFGA